MTLRFDISCHMPNIQILIFLLKLCELSLLPEIDHGGDMQNEDNCQMLQTKGCTKWLYQWQSKHYGYYC